MSTLSSVNITILGSASAQPSSTRNHSALALRLDGDVWLFDCGEATQHQIQKSSVKIGKVQRIFITHTHGQSLPSTLLDTSASMRGLSKRASHCLQATTFSGYCLCSRCA